ncbi:Uncharacterised protein [BD1-7 clade bacterium]|uniref:DUF1631 domain-containing protein n=1 Tax=BD1-7 clade bacterium TaxID=2029982 RepID=A0A5S9QEV0_9GAMM|nr:Uncharacterised protein [BD1-7 clade bacterium]CAA0116937.1 Uncharacterised protein [BD1-7 clade bacterium]
MPILVDKSAVIAGDQDQLNALICAHFIGTSSVAGEALTDADQQHLANMAFKSLAGYSSWDVSHIDKMLVGLEKNAKLRIPGVTRAQLVFNIHLVNAVARRIQLDSPLAEYLSRLSLHLFCYSLRDMEIWQHGHAILQTIDRLNQLSVGWQADFPKHSDAYKQLLDELVTDLQAVEFGNSSELIQRCQQSEQRIEQQLKRYSTLSQRLCDSEAGALKARQANDTVIRFFNKCSKNRHLPAQVADYIRNTLVSELKLVIVGSGGLGSGKWLRLRKLIETLFVLYQPGGVDLNDPRKKAMLTQVPEELKRALESLSITGDEAEAFLNQVGFDFAKIAANAADFELEPVAPLPIDDVTADIETSVASNLMDHAKQFDEGHWFIHKDEAGKRTRMRLALKLTDFEQVMFTNFVGKKVMSLSVSDFAYLLSSRSVVPVYAGSITDRAYQRLLEQLLDGYDVIYQRQLDDERRSAEARRAKEAEAKRLADLEEQQREQEKLEQARQAQLQAERLQAEQEVQERALAAEKARQEAEALRQQEAEEARQQQLEKVTADLKKQARLALDSLSLGSWIDLKQTSDAEMIRVKLAVKFNATKRYIFVDHDGVTVGEYHRDDLVEKVLIGEALLLESDERFAQRLVKVVETIKSGR